MCAKAVGDVTKDPDASPQLLQTLEAGVSKLYISVPVRWEKFAKRQQTTSASKTAHNERA